MFPRPIEQTSRATQIMYKVALPVALILWLFPLLGVALTSLRPASDLEIGRASLGKECVQPCRSRWSPYH